MDRLETTNEYQTRGLINTRGVSDNFKEMKIDGTSLTITKLDLDNGYQIGPSTLNFNNNETREVRLINRYVFNTITLDMIWSLSINLLVLPKGKMNIHPTLLQIRMLEGDQIIDSELPHRLIDDIIKTINDSIKNMHYKVEYLHLDQIEGLADIGVISRPDLLLERLVGIAETRGDLDVTQLRYSRMIPDSLSLTLSIQKIRQ
jgi:hypothetical protein